MALSWTVNLWAEGQPAAVSVAEQLSCGGREAQAVGETVFRHAARVKLALLSGNLACSFNKQEQRINKQSTTLAERVFGRVNVHR